MDAPGRRGEMVTKAGDGLMPSPFLVWGLMSGLRDGYFSSKKSVPASGKMPMTSPPGPGMASTPFSLRSWARAASSSGSRHPFRCSAYTG